MKIYQDKIIPERVDRVCVHRECDVCGERSSDGDWRRDVYEVGETSIRMKLVAEVGTAYPGSYDTTQYEIDLCPKCFVDKLVPWVNSQRGDRPPIKGVEVCW